MNFNAMDLIHIKESLYDVNSIPFKNISNFINTLLTMQCEGIKDESLKKKLGKSFFVKQDLIEVGFKLSKSLNKK